MPKMGGVELFHHIEEISSAGVAIRVDVISKDKYERILTDETYLDYRLAGVKRYLEYQRPEADFIWYPDEKEKSISYEKDKVIIKGAWFEGEIQKILVSFLASKMEKAGYYLFHASAVNYRNKTIAFISGESNAGKTMCQVEACRRGGRIVSTETIVTDVRGNVVMGSKKVFLRQRAKGTERVDKPDQDEGIAKFFSQTPEFRLYEEPTGIDIVVVPDIDGNFDTVVAEMADFEKQYQTFHCLCDYIGMHLLLAPKIPMPLFETADMRVQRARFINEFSRRPYYYIRGKNPQIILDQLEIIMDKGGI